MRAFGWIGICASVLLYVGCANRGVGSGGDAAASAGSGGASGSGGSVAPMGSGGNGSGGNGSGGNGSGGNGSGGNGSGGSAADAAPVIDSGPTSSDAPAQGACTAGTLKPGNTTLMIQSGGATRSYIVHVPPKYDGKTRLPLVIDMHGKGDTAAHQITWSGWREKADA
ncbi:MAG TPA: hypothetical protein VFH73_27835, partial [Polyangia bacterium]|nr:hypothetical protein [Polyangia bacterium]